MAKYLLLKHYRGAPAAGCDVPMDQWTPEEISAHMQYMRDFAARLETSAAGGQAQCAAAAGRLTRSRVQRSLRFMTEHCMTGRRAILSGSIFEEQIGYARAVVDGDRVHVSGTTGFDYATMMISDDVVEQARQCLRNIADALSRAGCGFADVVRVRYLLPERGDFEPCWPLLRECFGQARPAATMLVCGLSDPRMKIEIEVDARRRESVA
jgi:enamine deaminase RidA (YjgF/YER057c/UK114 family)